MDKDIRAALFDGFDEDGEFEELQDDFITQVPTSSRSAYSFTLLNSLRASLYKYSNYSNF